MGRRARIKRERRNQGRRDSPTASKRSNRRKRMLVLFLSLLFVGGEAWWWSSKGEFSDSDFVKLMIEPAPRFSLPASTPASTGGTVRLEDYVGKQDVVLWAYMLSLTGVMSLKSGVYLVMVVNTGLILLGFTLLAVGWKEVYRGEGVLVTDGLYGKMRHPQYLGLTVIVVAFLFMWPTLLTLLLAPFLIDRYVLLAREEDDELEQYMGMISDITERMCPDSSLWQGAGDGNWHSPSPGEDIFPIW